jgi:uncharacterized membrane protein
MAKKIMAGFRTNLLIGLFLLAPLVGTLLIVKFVIDFISSYIVPERLLDSNFGILYRIAAFLVVLAVIYFVGLLTRNFFGRKIYHLVDGVLTHIPIINSVYTSIRQISESIVNTQSTLFKDVVAVQFPREGLYSMGFVTSPVPEFIAKKIKGDGKNFICVFVPTTPNPTTGFFLMVARSELVFLNISVASAMKMVITAGAALPWSSEPVSRMTLLDHIETWLKRGEEKYQTAEKSEAEKAVE